MDIKFSPNLFLEVAELNRFKRSMVDDGYKKAIKCLARSFGVVGWVIFQDHSEIG